MKKMSIKTWMKRVGSGALALTIAFGLAACGSSSGQTDSSSASGSGHDDITGKIMIYTSMYDDIIANMKTELKNEFPNLDVEFFQGGTGTLQSKVAAEKESGKLGCDILMVAEQSYAMELKEQGMLHPHIFPEADKLAFEYDKEGYWYPVRSLNMVLAYNPEKYKEDEVPHTMKDFAENEKYKGDLSMTDPLTSGSSYCSMVGLMDKYGDGYFRSLGHQDVTLESGSNAVAKLETGEIRAAMILEETILKKREEEHSPLTVIYPEDGSVPVPSPIVIVDAKYSANNNIKAAEALQEYFLSPAGQKLIIKGWMYGVRSDMEEHPYDSKTLKEMLKNTIPVDYEKCLRQRDDIRTLIQKELEN